MRRRSLTAAVAAFACATGAAAQEPAYEAPTGTDGVQRVAIVGGSYFFRPAHILAKAGRPLEIEVSREAGIVPHNFVLEGPDGGKLADLSLETDRARLRVELAPGRYPFYCSNRLLFFASHRERGMSGVLEVAE